MSAHILQRLPLTNGRTAPLSSLWKRLRNFLARGVAGAGADRVSMQLDAGQELRLDDAAGWTVACLRGAVWITQEADTRDVFLDAGDDFTLDRVGLALILARQAATLAIRTPVGIRSRRTESSGPDAIPAPAPGSEREVWLKALYPECGPWNDPAAYRRSGLL